MKTAMQQLIKDLKKNSNNVIILNEEYMQKYLEEEKKQISRAIEFGSDIEAGFLRRNHHIDILQDFLNQNK